MRYIPFNFSSKYNIVVSLLWISWDQTKKKTGNFRKWFEDADTQVTWFFSLPFYYFFKLRTSLSLQYITEAMKNEPPLFCVCETKTINWKGFIFFWLFSVWREEV